MKLSDVKKTLIVGTGLLGGSVGLALKQRSMGGQIIGVGRRQETLDKAIAVGAIDTGTTDLLDAAQDADLILLATPVETLIQQMKSLADLDLSQKVITDVGSTKRSIVQLASEIDTLRHRFVGSHPMAGSSAHGPDAAHADLFEGKMVIVTPTDHVDKDARQLVIELWETIGLRVMEMDAQNHDGVVARISHLPHAVAVLLVQLVMGTDALSAASTGFRDTTRVASGDPMIWADIFLDNQEQVLSAMAEFKQLLNQLMDMIRSGERDKMIELLKEVQRVRQAWGAGKS